MSTTEPRVEAVQSLRDFLAETRAQQPQGPVFENETARTLRVDVDGCVWLKPGAAIAYRGDLTFERLPILRGESVMDAVLRETAPLVRAVGKGRLYCGHHGAHLRTVQLRGESIVVSWQDLVAFDQSLTFESGLLGHGLGLAAGGLVVVKLSGHGSFAVATHGRPITLEVSPGHPLSTDPHATIAWSADLSPTLKLDVTWRSAFGHGGHEPVQMLFDGAGFVVVQPYEDPSRFGLGPHPIRRVASLFAG
jgi:uncharacterized protein (AIM24 family)